MSVHASRRSILIPKFVTSMKTCDRSQLTRDVLAGIVVGVVALPLAIAFAIASGVGPSAGLWTAIVAGFIISVLGGSRVQIGGPAGAFVVIVYGIVQKHGVDGLAVATLMAGVLLIAFGVFRFGGMIKFIPQPARASYSSHCWSRMQPHAHQARAGLRPLRVPLCPPAFRARPWAPRTAEPASCAIRGVRAPD